MKFPAYKKFVKFYSSINVYGHRRSHNVYLCKKSIKMVFEMNDIKFDLLGYNESSCKKCQVNLISTEWDEIERKYHDQQVELFMFRCPAVQTQYLPREMKFFCLTDLVSNLSTHSATLFTRNNLGRRPRTSCTRSQYLQSRYTYNRSFKIFVDEDLCLDLSIKKVLLCHANKVHKSRRQSQMYERHRLWWHYIEQTSVL